MPSDADASALSAAVDASTGLTGVKAGEEDEDGELNEEHEFLLFMIIWLMLMFFYADRMHSLSL